MIQKIRIKLKSYDHAMLDNSAGEIVRAARRTGALTSGPVPLPTKKTIYTVLRSPHVDKKSREQFEIRIHKRLIDITRSSPPEEVLEQMAHADAINQRLRQQGYQIGFALSPDSTCLQIELRDASGAFLRMLSAEEAVELAAGRPLE